MLGPRLTFAIVLIVVLGSSSTVQAQDSVPGGWDEQVNYQSFHPPAPTPASGGEAVFAGFGGFGVGSWSSWGTSTGTGPIARPAVGPSLPGYQTGPPHPQVQNALVPLASVVRKSIVRKRSRR
jgi:hypothetical protein